MQMTIRRLSLYLFHGLAVGGSYFLAYLLRFDFAISPEELARFLRPLPLLFAARFAAFFYYQLFQGWWSYTSLRDAELVLRANVVGSLLFVVGSAFVYYGEPFPRSIWIMDFILCTGFLLSARLAARIYRENTRAKFRQPEKNVLVIGAGEAGVRLLQEVEANPALGMHIVGLIDDDPVKRKALVRGVQVLGTTEQISQISRKIKFDEIVIAIPSASGKDIQRIVKNCEESGAHFRILPPLAEFISGELMWREVREVELEDLLEREPVKLDIEGIQAFLNKRLVLVTGAAGSIGSEICRQVAVYKPQMLVILDQDESGVVLLERELHVKYPTVAITSRVCDIQDRKTLQQLFNRVRPEIVFHAAAYKHVPFLEEHVTEAVKNNVLGTRNVVEAAAEVGVRHFVMISTDKAVKPISVMGATKRMAEMIVHSWKGNKASFVCVRFGNVLGSRGSVVPIWKEQIRRGGPVTITDPAAHRFFMTIPEAVQLVLQAAAMGKEREIFVLDMGEPIKILDMARNLIQLSGYEPEKDIPIVFTGLRPGEKLGEEWRRIEEELIPTANEKIKLLKNHDKDGVTQGDLAELEKFVNQHQDDAIIRFMAKKIPDYQPSTMHKTA